MMSRDNKNEKFKLALVSVVLVLVTMAVYWPTLGHDFVNYDDGDYVFGNPKIQQGLNWPTLAWAFTTGHASNWHPLTWISHALDCQFYGVKPGGPHLTNLLFHTANALLIFWVFRFMTGSIWRSAFVAALFAWHPLHVESVAWISERKDVLSTFFWFLTMLAYAVYVNQSKIKNQKSKIFYALSLVCFVLGLLSKPMLVTLPFVLLLLDYWPLQRIAFTEKPSKTHDSNQHATRNTQHTFLHLILEKLPFLLLALASSIITFLVQQKGGAVSKSISFGARVSNALVSYMRYLGKIFWPHNLSVLYPHPGSWPMIWILAAIVLLLVITAAVLLTARKHPYLPVGWFWFLGTLVPVIGIVQVGVQSMADRYTYIPALGLFIMLAWGVAELLANLPRHNFILGAASAIVLASCLIVTHVQVAYWQNGETLFRHVVAVTHDNYLAYNNLGFFLENHGQPDEALADYEKSIAINPNYEDAQNNLGHALAAKGKYTEAISHYLKALTINPSLVEAHNNLGNALSNVGQLDAAIAEYEAALRCRPDDEDAHNNLGIARAMQGRLDEAVQLLTEAVRLKPSDPGAHSNLGNALAAQHKLDEAAKQYQLCLQLRPEDSQARNNLANVLTEQGHLDEARENYLTALKLNPNNPEANYNLGILLMRQGKLDEAIKRFTEALRLRPDYADARHQLDGLTAHRSN